MKLPAQVFNEAVAVLDEAIATIEALDLANSALQRDPARLRTLRDQVQKKASELQAE